MIDLHSHILPKLCDGAQDLETAIAMAQIAVADGITHLACTPHIYPPMYCNNTSSILPAILLLQEQLNQRNIPLQLVAGADINMQPSVIQDLRNGIIPTLNGSRYFLLEPSHHVPVNNFLGEIENFLYAGYIPIITHPERLSWVNSYYHDFIKAVHMGAWLQITAGSITGNFGTHARKMAVRFLKEGYVHIIASDAHGIKKRPPILSEAVEEAIKITKFDQEIYRMVKDRPRAIVDNLEPDLVPPPLALQEKSTMHKKNLLRSITQLFRSSKIQNEQ